MKFSGQQQQMHNVLRVISLMIRIPYVVKSVSLDYNDGPCFL